MDMISVSIVSYSEPVTVEGAVRSGSLGKGKESSQTLLNPHKTQVMAGTPRSLLPPGTAHPPSVEAASSSLPLLPEEGTELQIQEREIGPWLLEVCPPPVCVRPHMWAMECAGKTGPKLGLLLPALP